LLSIASIRYRSVLASAGGPIAAIEEGAIEAFGKTLRQANARLQEGLAPRPTLQLYSDADGTGMHRSAAIARHIAISEALERWAYAETILLGNGPRFGFDVDTSTNGMAAFPGIGTRQAQLHARHEAVERHCLLSWWEGLLDGEWRKTPWPQVKALELAAPCGIKVVLLYAKSRHGYYAYGHAAGASYKEACNKASLELIRHEWSLMNWQNQQRETAPKEPFERRSWFYSTEQGHQLFLERCADNRGRRLDATAPICDAEIRGPWSHYATVWRFLFTPPSRKFMDPSIRFFYW
jgi:hypothetical protein